MVLRKLTDQETKTTCATPLLESYVMEQVYISLNLSLIYQCVVELNGTNLLEWM
jgi:hypothetical protein